MFAYDYAYKGTIPNPGHGADDVWIALGPNLEDEKTLQEAIFNDEITRNTYVDNKIENLNTSLTPPRCIGEDEALQFDGTNWNCKNLSGIGGQTVVSGGGGGGVTCPCGVCYGERESGGHCGGNLCGQRRIFFVCTTAGWIINRIDMSGCVPCPD